MRYLPYVNVRMGTDSVPEFSNGNTLPLCAVPYGTHHYSPETRSEAALFFNAHDVRTKGIRLTHLMSPWLGDYDCLTMNAVFDDGRYMRVTPDGEPVSSYDRDRAILSPGYIRMRLNLYAVTLSLAPTAHGGVLRAEWEDEDTEKYFTLSAGDGVGKEVCEAVFELSEDGLTLTGSSKTLGWSTKNIPGDFRLYFVYRFDRPADGTKSYLTGRRAALAFGKERLPLNVRFSASFISIDQAKLALTREIGSKTLEDVRTVAEAEWEKGLSRIETDASEEMKKTFYSCLYRTLLFPRAFHETDEHGRVVHFSPLTGDVRPGPFYTDNCFWDTFRTSFPLFSIVSPSLYADMCEGFLNFYRESGWLPRCVSPAAINCMPGTAIDAVFADAAVKDVVPVSVLPEMLEALCKHAENVSPDPATGRDGISDFNSIGYVGNSFGESVNKTLDYAYGNYCIARIAEKLGDDETREKYLRSARNYRLLFDPETGFFRARDKDGNMRPDFSDIDWGGDYTEGSAWQNSFAVYHDLYGYASLLGGREKFTEKLRELFAKPPVYRLFGYSGEIHEMTEMAFADGFGQCALSNQPSFHIPYLNACMGDHDGTAYIVRKAVKELFSSGADGFPGDEDTGSMGAWYVFSALGFYPVCPGSGEYVIGSPSVKKAVIHLENGKSLTVEAKGVSDKNVYVSSVKLNGKKTKCTYLTHAELIEGGTLTFRMSGSPAGRSFSDEELPFSLSGKR